jgi:hydrogenase maturation protein HypF
MNRAVTYCERIEVTGIVQGVGFRPFVYQLARSLVLGGSVRNHTAGVTIELFGCTPDLDRFAAQLESEAPPLARIVSINRQREPIPDQAIPNSSAPDFIIAPSHGEARPTALIAPDSCVCDDCLAEMFHTGDRRHLYPFINCTNCGPRFTIIQSLPYDRPATTMSNFTQCETCLAEYENPLDRRFHAQPNACADCGPALSLVDAGGAAIEGDPVLKTLSLLKQGRIVAIKGLGGFHLAVDASNEAAVSRLRRRKLREEKPLAIMVGTSAIADGYVHLNKDETHILLSRERPILLARKRQTGQSANVYPIAQPVAPGNPYLGIMLPYTPLHYLLFFHPLAGGDIKTGAATLSALVMTSANISDEPICKDNDEALSRLAHIADAFLIHNREIHVRCDDSVVTRVDDRIGLQRRSRGYAPMPVFLAESAPVTLAFGAELKNTLCLIDDRRAFLSQHIGDLEQTPTLSFYEEAVAHFTNIFDLKPTLFAYDLHPEYLSTKYFSEFWRSCDHSVASAIGCQHHHAHIAGLLAEFQHQGPVIGFTMDGTGYGPDGTIWGGEMLICAPQYYIRRAFFKPVPLPGEAAAIKAPWRMAVSYLLDSDPDRLSRELATDMPRLPALCQVSPGDIRLLLQTIEAGLNCRPTSSLGRLFDAIASLLDLKHHCAFEGQAAMMLEMLAEEAQDQSAGAAIEIERLRSHATVGFPELKGKLAAKADRLTQLVPRELADLQAYRFNCAPFVSAILQDFDTTPLDRKRQAAWARQFHQALAQLFLKAAFQARDETGINTVAISGGCWQNRLLRELLRTQLETAGFEIMEHRLVPPNDGGISLGQAYIAASLERSL